MVENGRPRKQFGIVEVTGPSMAPTLAHGDQVLVRYGAAVRPGGVVVLRHPFQQDLLVVKRAVERRPGGAWWVLGDNPYNEAPGDSTVFGPVPAELVLATALVRFRPREEDQRSLRARLSWAASAVRPLRADSSASSRLRAR
ncbi:nickel-type superoxide dismutase maturation protease [Streptomyces venezuelae]|uniref:Nickel-type superoxide dismutase maturation protease n=1 Tax=Streptomyces venezuelae TaxID=54571 RepID=A0A5P2DNE7_STRVZ|nr:nickel-type superoxide dismutase maturation protease [Streptomyces venezuelae]QES56606.1 nickel-type superoxide dismutase maturation protease [Streptomyces venezuelae]